MPFVVVATFRDGFQAPIRTRPFTDEMEARHYLSQAQGLMRNANLTVEEHHELPLYIPPPPPGTKDWRENARQRSQELRRRV